jgi:hypothetical protein
MRSRSSSAPETPVSGRSSSSSAATRRGSSSRSCRATSCSPRRCRR